VIATFVANPVVLSVFFAGKNVTAVGAFIPQAFRNVLFFLVLGRDALHFSGKPTHETVFLVVQI
jgi:hypothetical protein